MHPRSGSFTRAFRQRGAIVLHGPVSQSGCKCAASRGTAAPKPFNSPTSTICFPNRGRTLHLPCQASLQADERSRGADESSWMYEVWEQATALAFHSVASMLCLCGERKSIGERIKVGRGDAEPPDRTAHSEVCRTLQCWTMPPSVR